VFFTGIDTLLAQGDNTPGANAPGANAQGGNAQGGNAPGANTPGGNAPDTDAPPQPEGTPRRETPESGDTPSWLRPPWKKAPEPSQSTGVGGHRETWARKLFKSITNLCFWLVCLSMITGSVLFAVSNDPQKSYLGYRTYSVLTDSMTPRADGSSPPGGFGKGAVILIRMCRPEDVKVGDIITFNPSAREEENTMFLTHRVKEIKNELGGKEGIFLVTRGDANNSDDPPISGDMLIGKKVFHIPGVGGFLQKVRENFLLSILTVISLFACILLFRWYFAAPKRPRMSGYTSAVQTLAASM
jgi:signal peptidase I